MNTIATTREQVKARFLRESELLFERVMSRAEHADEDVVLDLEHLASAGHTEIARDLLAISMARACEVVMERDLAARRLARDQVRVRMEKDYFAGLSTTLGLIVFPWFAYRRPTGATCGFGFVTENPARALLPYYARCRSSPVCLQWEARLGSRDAFRRAQEMLNFVTRGALRLEDTTIERHMMAAARLVDPSWLYRKPEDIRGILAERATRDLVSGRPILYASTDGHALRRYAGETWAWGWMVVNGIRLWCEDAQSGQIIHLGGEFTWGDCRKVAARFGKLRALGVLPNETPEWKAVNAQVAFISDGAEWITDHVLPVISHDAIVILDPFHVVGWLAALGVQLFGSGTTEAKTFHSNAWAAVFGEPRSKRHGSDKKRRGHKKTPPGTRRQHSHDRYLALAARLRSRSANAMTKALLDLLAIATEVADEPSQVEEIERIATRVTNNAARMRYPVYLERGFQVGSGAMESLHRSASQPRLKRSGRWLEESSQAVLHFRMLELSGRWDEFWAQRNLPHQLVRAFSTSVPNPAHEADRQEAAVCDDNPASKAA